MDSNYCNQQQRQQQSKFQKKTKKKVCQLKKRKAKNQTRLQSVIYLFYSVSALPIMLISNTNNKLNKTIKVKKEKNGRRWCKQTIKVESRQSLLALVNGQNQFVCLYWSLVQCKFWVKNHHKRLIGNYCFKLVQCLCFAKKKIHCCFLTMLCSIMICHHAFSLFFADIAATVCVPYCQHPKTSKLLGVYP